MSLGETVAILAFAHHVADLSDHVVAGIFAVSVLLCLIFTRKWIKSAITDEFVSRLRKRF
jgi:hypothetical protein